MQYDVSVYFKWEYLNVGLNLGGSFDSIDKFSITQINI